MTNDEVFYLLTKVQNPHYKYKMRAKKPFILYIKNINFPKKVFYVKYTDDGIVLSTGETDLQKAEKIAVEHLEDHTKEGIQERKQADEFHKFKEINKQRLIKLQSDLLDLGLSVKTVKNNFTAFERIYKELLDKDLINHNPFPDVPPLKSEISQAWDGFPIRPFQNILPLLPIHLENETDFIYALLG